MSSRKRADLYKKGVELLYKQCDPSRFDDAINYLDEAARAGNADAWYILGHCFSWGDGLVGFNKEKAYDCFLRGVKGGSYLAVLGALRAGQFDRNMHQECIYTVRECWNHVLAEANAGDEICAWQLGETIEWGDLAKLTEEELNTIPPKEEETAPAVMVKEDETKTEEKAGSDADGEAQDEEKTRSKKTKTAKKTKSTKKSKTDETEPTAEAAVADTTAPATEAAAEDANAAAPAKDPGLRIRRVITNKFPKFVIPEPKTCLLFYSRAADIGIVPAMEKLGKCCQEGRFTSVDTEGYLQWARKCSSIGSAWGLCELGLYWIENGDDEAAFRYMEAAEIQGDPRANYPLGMYYLEGKVTERDLDKAIECLEKAGEMDDNRSFMALGDLFYQDMLVERDDAKAFYWYSRAYGDGHGEAALALAHLYLRETEYQDNHKAVRLLEEAGASENPEVSSEANLMLGNIFRDGLTGIQDPVRAIYFYETGAQTGSPECMELVAMMYYQGEDGIAPNYEKAYYWLNLCEENGTLQSVSKLATLYLKGLGCEKDEARAKELFEKASRTEYDGYAFYMLAQIAEQSGTPEDLEYAVSMYDRAIDMGYSDAAKRLSHFKKTLFGRWKVTN